MDNVLADSGLSSGIQSRDGGVHLSRDGVLERKSSVPNYEREDHRSVRSRRHEDGEDRRSVRSRRHEDSQDRRSVRSRRHDDEQREQKIRDTDQSSVHESNVSESDTEDDQDDNEPSKTNQTYKPRLNQTTGVMLHIFGDTLFPAGVDHLGTYFDSNGRAFRVYKFDSEHVKSRTFRKLIRMEKESRDDDMDCVQGGDVRVGSVDSIDFAVVAIPKHHMEDEPSRDVLALVLVYKGKTRIRPIGFRGPKEYLRPTITTALLCATTSQGSVIHGVQTHVPKHSVGFASQTGFKPSTSCTSSSESVALDDAVKKWSHEKETEHESGENVWDEIADQMKNKGLEVESSGASTYDSGGVEDEDTEVHATQFKMIFCWKPI